MTYLTALLVIKAKVRCFLEVNKQGRIEPKSY